MIHFPAAYAGRCRNCNEVFVPGDEVFYVRGEDTVTGWDCCGDQDDAETASETTPAGQVMPRGKTARDACARCFQVPASNGACGCDA